MSQKSALLTLFEIAGATATCVWLYSLVNDVPKMYARLDDVASVEPRPYDLAGESYADTGNMAGLGDPFVAALPLTDDPAAPLKLRRMAVVRPGQPAAAALRVLIGNTAQRAKRANRDIPAIVQNVVRRYGSTIQAAAALHNVPAALIATKMSIENPDLLVKVVTGGGATGLMQITPGTADNVIRTEMRDWLLLPAEADFFKAQLGQARWLALAAGRKAHRTADLQNPTYCIHIGALAFGQMLRKYTNTATGEVALYKAAAEYNRGERAAYANARVSNPDQLIGFRSSPAKYNTPSITQEYIKLYCGPGGPLDYIHSHSLLA